MSAIHLEFYSDCGPRCLCGGTIYGYTKPNRQGTVKTFCYTCHTEGRFYPTGDLATAADYSAEHRDAFSD